MGNLDINIGKLKKNAFRYSKVRGETASRIRIPGGVIDANSMSKVVEIAEKYGNGVINITNRQGIEIPGISLKDIPPPGPETLSPAPARACALSAAMTPPPSPRRWRIRSTPTTAT